MAIDRRSLLALLGIGAAAPGTAVAAEKGEVDEHFRHGVASGDPLHDRVILWTRLTPHEGETSRAVNWTVKDEAGKVVAKGTETASADRDWTVKVDAKGLKAGTWYSYQFDAYGHHSSPIGRTRTLPKGATDKVVMAVASCALFRAGYFNAYQAIADQERVDVVVHLGDYIYEYGGGETDYGGASSVAKDRPLEPLHEIVSLADYRTRHACYKADAALQAAHAKAPWIVVWDDHETANDSFMNGAENHNPPGEGDWAARKAVALKAYYEWMPIREAKAGVGLVEAVSRSFAFGDLARLIMVETRLTARTEPLDLGKDLMGPGGQPDLPGFFGKLKDPNRQLMGPVQEKWLADELAGSVKAGETWQVLGNQIVMGKVYAPGLKKQMGEEGFAALLAKVPPEIQQRLVYSDLLSQTEVPVNLDQWDGYPAARERVYDAFKAAKARPVVLAGDSHSFWANELCDAAGTQVAVEFGATGVTSPGFVDLLPGAPLNEALVARNREVKYANSGDKGYVLLTLTKDEAKAEMMAVSTIYSTDFTAKSAATFTAKPLAGGGVSELRRAS